MATKLSRLQSVLWASSVFSSHTCCSLWPGQGTGWCCRCISPWAQPAGGTGTGPWSRPSVRRKTSACNAHTISPKNSWINYFQEAFDIFKHNFATLNLLLLADLPKLFTYNYYHEKFMIFSMLCLTCMSSLESIRLCSSISCVSEPIVL